MLTLTRHPLGLAVLIALAVMLRGMPMAPSVAVASAPEAAGVIVFIPCGGGGVVLSLSAGETAGAPTASLPTPAAPANCCEDCKKTTASTVGAGAPVLPPPLGVEASGLRAGPGIAIPERRESRHARAPPAAI
ncbi:MAG: hypothetical protein AAF577_16455 [Pseudomonadota bacterium]